MKAPTMSTPKVSAPAMKTPAIKTPSTTMPKITAPKVSIASNMPKLVSQKPVMNQYGKMVTPKIVK